MEYSWLRVSLVAQTVKNLPFLGRKPRLVNSVVLISCVQQSDHIYIYIYIYVCVCVCVCVCDHIYIYVCMYIHTHTYIYVCMYVYTHTHNTFLSFFLFLTALYIMWDTSSLTRS